MMIETFGVVRKRNGSSLILTLRLLFLCLSIVSNIQYYLQMFSTIDIFPDARFSHQLVTTLDEYITAEDEDERKHANGSTCVCILDLFLNFSSLYDIHIAFRGSPLDKNQN